jgi:hypothetical protein
VTDEATGRRFELRGAALVAADGVDSLTRKQLQISLDGEMGLHYFINCYFRADIERYVRDRRGVLLFIANPHAAGVLQPLDANGRWLCQIAVPKEQWTSDCFDQTRVQQWVRGAVGVGDELAVEVLSIGRWRMNVAVAEQLARGRIVLCGDAAHQFPPTGGLGVNTGIQGMHNAMWKLAMCVTGRAGWRLLDTYEVERRTPAKRTADQSLENHRRVQMIAAAAFSRGAAEVDPEVLIRESRRYGNHLGVEFGTVYTSSAVIPDGTIPPTVEDEYSDYLPSATPGCRAPHVWLGRRDEKLSTVDLFGAGFTVLTGPKGDSWRATAAEVAKELRVRLASYSIGAPGLEDRDSEFFERYAIGPAGAVLVRPDGYVGWRSSAADEPAELKRAVEEILAR